MNAPVPPQAPQAEDPPSPDEQSPGLPLFRTWPAVYMLVVACFALWVVILAVLPRIFA